MLAATASGRLAVYSRVEDLPPIWDTLAQAGGLSLDRRFLHAVQQSAVDSRNKRYLVYQTPSGAAVIAVGALLRSPSTRNPIMSNLLGRLNNRVPSARNWLLPMLVLHADLSSDAPVAAVTSAGLERQSLFRQMLQGLEMHASREGWSVAVAGIPTNDVALTGALNQQGYLYTVGRPFTELHVGYDSWEAFLKFATSQNKAAAANIRYETNRARRAGMAIVEWDPASLPETELYRLLDEHHWRLNNRSFDFQPGFLGILTRALADRVRVLLALCEGRLQGVVVVAWTGSRGYLMFPGMLAKAERTGFAYFNLVYYEPIRLAIELGLERLAYGNGAFQAKIRRGCTAAETGIFFWPRRGLIRTTLRGPVALHRRLLQRKYAATLRAPAFSCVP